MINSGRFLKLKPTRSMVVSFNFHKMEAVQEITGERERDLVSSVICSGAGPYCISMIFMSSMIDLLKTLVGIRERCRVNVSISFM